MLREPGHELLGGVAGILGGSDLFQIGVVTRDAVPLTTASAAVPAGEVFA